MLDPNHASSMLKEQSIVRSRSKWGEIGDLPLETMAEECCMVQRSCKYHGWVQWVDKNHMPALSPFVSCDFLALSYSWAAIPLIQVQAAIGRFELVLLD